MAQPLKALDTNPGDLSPILRTHPLTSTHAVSLSLSLTHVIGNKEGKNRDGHRGEMLGEDDIDLTGREGLKESSSANTSS